MDSKTMIYSWPYHGREVISLILKCHNYLKELLYYKLWSRFFVLCFLFASKQSSNRDYWFSAMFLTFAKNDFVFRWKSSFYIQKCKKVDVYDSASRLVWWGTPVYCKCLSDKPPKFTLNKMFKINLNPSSVLNTRNQIRPV